MRSPVWTINGGVVKTHNDASLQHHVYSTPPGSGWVLKSVRLGYTIGKFELTGTIFTDVLLRRYWNHNNYLGSIEPYPRAAIGGSVGLGYKINLKK